MLAHQYALLTRMHTYGMEYVFFFFVRVVLARLCFGLSCACLCFWRSIGGYLGVFVAIPKCGQRGTPKGGCLWRFLFPQKGEGCAQEVLQRGEGGGRNSGVRYLAPVNFAASFGLSHWAGAAEAP